MKKIIFAKLFVLSLVISACATTPQTESPKVSKTLMVKEIPFWVLSPCNVPTSEIAEVGASWNRTCIGNGLPRAHLVSACESKGVWKVVCEEGGYSVNNKSITAEKLPDGRMRVEYIWSLQKPVPMSCD